MPEHQQPQPAGPQEPGVDLVLFSFGFKHGVPADATMLWDVRFLPNPYWVEELSPLSGCEAAVSDYVVKSSPGSKFLELFEPLLLFCLAAKKKRSEQNLRLAIGCTGGRHRSVAVVEELRRLLAERGIRARVFHRDLAREDQRETGTGTTITAG